MVPFTGDAWQRDGPIQEDGKGTRKKEGREEAPIHLLLAKAAVPDAHISTHCSVLHTASEWVN
jgi:hypothetical protein